MAYDTDGNLSPPSDTVSATIPANTSPSTPSTPGDFVVASTSFNTVTLSWNASTISGGGSIGGYLVYCNGQEVANTGNTTFTQSALTPGTGYIYTVVAYDSTGQLQSTPAEVGASTNIVGDLDDNGLVNAHDLSLFLGKWEQNYSPAEYDGTSLVQSHDLSMLLSNWTPQ